METKKIKAAAIISKKNESIKVKIWFTTPPEVIIPNTIGYYEDLKAWTETGQVYQFKDDLHGGKFMWLAIYIYRILYPGNANFFDLPDGCFFITTEYLYLIGIEDEKIYMKAFHPKQHPYANYNFEALLRNESKNNTSKESNAGKTITIKRKTLWNYFWTGITVGLIIGAGWGIVFATINF